MSIYVIGFNHKTAPITLREKIYFAVDKLPIYLQDLLNDGCAREAVLLSTCNRSELYCETDDISIVRDWFYAQTTAAPRDLDAALYIYKDETAIAHITEVACGLDSMVLGEPQILGQVKEAFSESCSAGAVGALFQRLFQQIFTVAKEIRTTTAIGACPVSVASAAVHFAKQQVMDFSQAQVALIGAGETSELLIRYLASQLKQPLALVNRHQEKAAALVETLGGSAYGIDHMTTVLAQSDMVFSATSSAVPLVTKAMMTDIMRLRGGRPIILMDLAVPRDMDPAIAELDAVNLYCIDDLKAIIDQNRKGREHAAEKAGELIRDKSKAVFIELQSLDKVAHTIRAYRGQIETLCRDELMKARRQLYLGEDPVQVLEAFSRNFTNKLMHAPSVQLRQAGAEGRFELLRFAKQLFSLPDPETELT